MNVRELIEKLKTFEQEKTVKMFDDYAFQYAEGVFEKEDGVYITELDEETYDRFKTHMEKMRR